MESTIIDKNDRAILRQLQKNSRISVAALANIISISESACRRRIEKLEQDGIIKGYRCEIDGKKLGFSLNVFVSISLGAQTDKDLTGFEQKVRTTPEILECWLMTGESDYLLRIGARDIADLERIHREVLTKLPNVTRVNTAIAMRSVCEIKNVAI
ncbi:MAG: Lrp/AsnC family transcriptional regulator [Caulobacterales bacterium]|nr:Lrp/AsnC family transcriptional regulator [Caulobacterales bacterium]